MAHTRRHRLDKQPGVGARGPGLCIGRIEGTGHNKWCEGRIGLEAERRRTQPDLFRGTLA